jgi:polyhydroxyalkanoate synthesis regulator phasin
MAAPAGAPPPFQGDHLMMDLIKRAVWTGVGMAVLTKEKVEELGKDLADQAKLSEQEGKKLVDELLKKSEQAQKDLEARVNNAVLKVVQSLHLASHEDVARLTARIEQLEQQLREPRP